AARVAGAAARAWAAWVSERRPLVPDDLESGRAEAELVEDLRPVAQVLGPGGALEVLGDDDGVARHHADVIQGTEKPSSPAGDRAVRPEHVDAALVGLLARAAGLGEVVGD